jgi:hypothetical protein
MRAALEYEGTTAAVARNGPRQLSPFCIASYVLTCEQFLCILAIHYVTSSKLECLRANASTPISERERMPSANAGSLAFAPPGSALSAA